MIPRSIFVTGLFLVVILTVSGCDSHKVPGDVVASVGGRYIRMHDLTRKLKEFEVDGIQGDIDSEVKKRLLNDLIERALLLQEAERRGIAISESELKAEIEYIMESYPGQEFEKLLLTKRLTLAAWKDELKKNLLAKRVADRIGSEYGEITDGHIAEYYKNNLTQFEEPEKAKALHILVNTEKDAFSALAKIRKGMPFETVAKETSQGPEAGNGGDLGYFKKGAMPAIFDETIFDLKPGKVSRVVASEYGYHIFKLIEKTPKTTRALEDCRTDIINKLREQRQKTAYSGWLESSLKQTAILKNSKIIAEL